MAWGRLPSFYLLNTKQLLHVRDEKTAGTNGGTSSSTTWHKRTLNTTLINSISGASIASSQITLPAGTYFVQASAPAVISNAHKLRLYNTTSSAEILTGTTEWNNAASTSSAQTRAFLFGQVTLSATGVLELQHYFTSGRATDGLGVSTNSGTEVYADLLAWKVN